MASSFGNINSNKAHTLPDGDYTILPFLDSSISVVKMKEIDLNKIAVDDHGQFMGDETSENESRSVAHEQY